MLNYIYSHIFNNINKADSIIPNHLIIELAEAINRLRLPHPVRVAVDGPGNAGKTTIAEDLCVHLNNLGRKVIRSTIDGFHYPSEIRYRRGKYSPRGYFEDSYNYPLLKKYLLDPLSPGGNLIYKKSIYNFKVNEPTNDNFISGEKDSILIFDGIFLFKKILMPYWDYKIYIHASFENTMQRAIERDKFLFGGVEEVKKLYKRRYIPGHEMYLSLCDPINVSDISINNDNYFKPTIIRLTESKLHLNLIKLKNISSST